MEEINEQEFKQAIESNHLVVVDFFATWCMPCRKMFSILEHVEKQHSDVRFYKVDIDENEGIAKELKIFSIPTIVAFKNGEIVDTSVGLKSVNEINDFVNSCK